MNLSLDHKTSSDVLSKSIMIRCIQSMPASSVAIQVPLALLTPWVTFHFYQKKIFLTRWAEQVPDPNGGSYMLLMALCALSSQTASLNAVFDHSLPEGVKIPDCENYFCETISVIPIRIVECVDFDYFRSFGLLAVYSIQRGNHNDLHRYLALYHALAAQHGFHEESRWPANLSVSGIDDRRRQF